MSISRTGLNAAAMLLAGAASLAAVPGSANAAPPAPPASNGIAKLHANINLPPGAWTDTPLEVTLPRRGTYELNADVRGRLIGTAPVNSYIVARLWNVTAGAAVPESERLIYQVINLNRGGGEAAGNATAPIHELITVTGPTRIRLQALDNNAAGRASVAQIYSDNVGYTALRYLRLNRP